MRKMNTNSYEPPQNIKETVSLIVCKSGIKVIWHLNGIAPRKCCWTGSLRWTCFFARFFLNLLLSSVWTGSFELFLFWTGSFYVLCAELVSLRYFLFELISAAFLINLFLKRSVWTGSVSFSSATHSCFSDWHSLGRAKHLPRENR